MAIGIDVCHSGPNSVVGFCATLDKYFNKYYNDYIVQPKFQELIKTELDRCLKNAILNFKQMNDDHMPDKIIIFRDGVGEQMRDQIVAKEITQFKEVIKEIYNTKNIPPITLVVVNKRINQRLFIEGKEGSRTSSTLPLDLSLMLTWLRMPIKTASTSSLFPSSLPRDVLPPLISTSV